ncbi:MAG: hypothetical protein EAX90_15810 [Candidatus Heimdallarchaeota archaeon]|nr:hypothetical protein [Candidatus Heimdallarchaeota archaeon]
MVRKKYNIELEIIESGCTLHKVGDKFQYPEDLGKLCPWLRESANTMLRILERGGHLGWTYKNTPYEKILKETLTTEYVRCPDPTDSGLVLKITRTKNPVSKKENND